MEFQLQSQFFLEFCLQKTRKKTRTNPAPLTLFVTR